MIRPTTVSLLCPPPKRSDDGRQWAAALPGGVAIGTGGLWEQLISKTLCALHTHAVGSVKALALADDRVWGRRPSPRLWLPLFGSNRRQQGASHCCAALFAKSLYDLHLGAIHAPSLVLTLDLIAVAVDALLALFDRTTRVPVLAFQYSQIFFSHTFCYLSNIPPHDFLEQASCH